MTYNITKNDVSTIKSMILRGDVLADIARHYDVNTGRISEINTGAKYAEIPPLSNPKTNQLPPMGASSTRRDLELAGHTILTKEKSEEIERKIATLSQVTGKLNTTEAMFNASQISLKSEKETIDRLYKTNGRLSQENLYLEEDLFNEKNKPSAFSGAMSAAALMAVIAAVGSTIFWII